MQDRGHREVLPGTTLAVAATRAIASPAYRVDEHEVRRMQRSRVVLRGSKRIFASVRVSARGLAGHVNLARRIPPGGLIRKVEPLTKTLYFHAFAVSAIDDLDAAFALLLCEARDVGDGKYMAD